MPSSLAPVVTRLSDGLHLDPSMPFRLLDAALKRHLSLSADTVDIRFGVGGQVVVEHHVDLGDVETAGGDVGGDGYVAGAGAELVEGAEAFIATVWPKYSRDENTAFF
ncbi:hypothetical protein PCL_02569 [Purpureocillium lilacinum]|uniref:Uncharacterized protein n=1 Tax=Purpureocillium lilacinum TaxID=33203 RepID=A0A2U3DNV9_PURLI|nr:hypothetical protein PCL_02569 [Purpureocillium lilacinum]